MFFLLYFKLNTLILKHFLSKYSYFSSMLLICAGDVINQSGASVRCWGGRRCCSNTNPPPSESRAETWHRWHQCTDVSLKTSCIGQEVNVPWSSGFIGNLSSVTLDGGAASAGLLQSVSEVTAAFNLNLLKLQSCVYSSVLIYS